MSAWLHAWAWPVLVVAPIAAAWLWWRRRATRRALETTAGAGAKRLVPLRPRGWPWFGAGVLLALLALLQPLGAEITRRVEERGVDVMLCLDVSRSMFARDIGPNRLARARREIGDLMRRAPNDRFGLVVFAGEARLLSPLTRDHDALRAMLADAGPDSVGLGGTDLAESLRTAGRALAEATGEHECIVLITDGEDHGGQGAAAAGVMNVAVHALGIGSVRGGKIPVQEGAGEAFLRDREGREVVSALDEASLRRVAETAGGRFVRVDGSRPALPALYDAAVAPMAKKALLAREKRARTNLFQWPLLAALFCWIMDRWRGADS